MWRVQGITQEAQEDFMLRLTEIMSDADMTIDVIEIRHDTKAK